MAELTLEALAKRMDELEQFVKQHIGEPRSIPPSRDWRTVIGYSEDNEFTRQMRAEMQARRDADRGDDPEAEAP